MNARLLATAVVAGAVAVAAAPAGAKPKVITQTYDVTEPVPFPMTTDVPGQDGCWNGQEGVTKNTKTLTFPAEGLFKAEVHYSGDWDLYLFDSKGNKAVAAETSETGNTGPAVEKVSYKKIKKGQKYTLVVCNWSGLPNATVTYTFTYGK